MYYSSNEGQSYNPILHMTIGVRGERIRETAQRKYVCILRGDYMKFNGATFNKAQQDQLKKKVGAELEDVIKKVDEVDSRMLNYTGDWVTGNEYHENDVVTWTDGHLYEVIKAHTSSPTIDPSNTEYYKAMTSTRLLKYTAHLVSGGTYFDDTTYNFIRSISRKIVYAETETATLSRPNIHGGITFSARHLFDGSNKDIIDYTLYISSAKYASVYSVTVKPNNTVTYSKMDINNFVGPSGITFYYTA